MIAVVDYGVGNLFSLCCSLERIGADAKVTSNPDEICSAEKIILPGVGAFADAAKKLRDSGLDKVILEQAAAGKETPGLRPGQGDFGAGSPGQGNYGYLLRYAAAV